MNRIVRILILLSCFGVPIFVSISYAIEQEIVITSYQGPCMDGEFQVNLQSAETTIQSALERKTDFLVFPETFLSGYSTPELVLKGARTMDDPVLVEFIQSSVSHNMVILIGLVRKTDQGLFNSILVIHHGQLMGIYDKVMLTSGDRNQLDFQPGKSIPVFQANGVTFGVIVCHDSSFPHLGMAARLKGAEILFTPHYNQIAESTVDDHRRWVRNCHVGLACQMKMVVERSNVVVTTKPHEPGYGDSFIISPQGEILAEARLFKTELITAKITPNMFRSPYVWANFNEVPDWVNSELADLLHH